LHFGNSQTYDMKDERKVMNPDGWEAGRKEYEFAFAGAKGF